MRPYAASFHVRAFLFIIRFMNSKRHKACRKLSRPHAIVLVRLCSLFPAASVLRGLATFYEHFTTRFLPLVIGLLDRRGAILCSASACLIEY
jgi:hypothetical protein